MSQKPLTIGIFDSGVGGLTVLKALQNALPFSNYIYMADTASFPYGSKSQEQLLTLTLENCAFLKQKGCDMIVIACHTATAFALENVQQKLSIPIIGVIDPVIDQINKMKTVSQIGVIATPATTASNMYQEKLLNLKHISLVTAVSAPLLAPLIERDYMNSQEIINALKSYIHPLIQTACDTIILGCTHYSWIKDIIQQMLPLATTLIDPADLCANEVKNTISHLNQDLVSQDPTHLFYVTQGPEEFQRKCKVFLGRPCCVQFANICPENTVTRFDNLSC